MRQSAELTRAALRVRLCRAGYEHPDLTASCGRYAVRTTLPGTPAIRCSGLRRHLRVLRPDSPGTRLERPRVVARTGSTACTSTHTKIRARTAAGIHLGPGGPLAPLRPNGSRLGAAPCRISQPARARTALRHRSAELPALLPTPAPVPALTPGAGALPDDRPLHQDPLRTSRHRASLAD